LKVTAVLFSALPSWGYSVREPNVSSVQPSLELPPPTTVVGALSYGLAKTLGLNYETVIVRSGKKPGVTTLSEMLWGTVLYSGASVEAYSPYTDINRLMIRIYQRKARREMPEYKFGAIAVGKVQASGLIKALVAFDEEKLAKLLGDLGWKGTVERALTESAYRVTRLGAKEGIVAVESVDVGEAKKVEGREFLSSFYQPFDAVQVSAFDEVECPQGFPRWRFLRAWEGGFTAPGEERVYLYPVCGQGYFAMAKGKYRLREGCEAYQFKEEGFAVCSPRR
jgi:CRISPR-associated protein Cas5 subtype I-A